MYFEPGLTKHLSEVDILQSITGSVIDRFHTVKSDQYHAQRPNSGKKTERSRLSPTSG